MTTRIGDLFPDTDAMVWCPKCGGDGHIGIAAPLPANGAVPSVAVCIDDECRVRTFHTGATKHKGIEIATPPLGKEPRKGGVRRES